MFNDGEFDAIMENMAGQRGGILDNDVARGGLENVENKNEENTAKRLENKNEKKIPISKEQEQKDISIRKLKLSEDMYAQQNVQQWLALSKSEFYLLFKKTRIVKLDNLDHNFLNERSFFKCNFVEKIFSILRWSVLNPKIMSCQWSWMKEPEEWTLVKNKFNVTYGFLVFRQKFTWFEQSSNQVKLNKLKQVIEAQKKATAEQLNMLNQELDELAAARHNARSEQLINLNKQIARVKLRKEIVEKLRVEWNAVLAGKERIDKYDEISKKTYQEQILRSRRIKKIKLQISNINKLRFYDFNKIKQKQETINYLLFELDKECAEEIRVKKLLLQEDEWRHEKIVECKERLSIVGQLSAKVGYAETMVRVYRENILYYETNHREIGERARAIAEQLHKLNQEFYELDADKIKAIAEQRIKLNEEIVNASKH